MEKTAKPISKFSAKAITITCSSTKELSKHIEKYVNQMIGQGYLYKEYQLIERDRLDDGTTKYQLLFIFMKKF